MNAMLRRHANEVVGVMQEYISSLCRKFREADAILHISPMGDT